MSRKVLTDAVPVCSSAKRELSFEHSSSNLEHHVHAYPIDLIMFDTSVEAKISMLNQHTLLRRREHYHKDCSRHANRPSKKLLRRRGSERISVLLRERLPLLNFAISGWALKCCVTFLCYHRIITKLGCNRIIEKDSPERHSKWSTSNWKRLNFDLDK